MKIVMTGGGSGGHITPILAVASEIKKADASIQVVYIGQRGDDFAAVVSEHTDIIDAVYGVRAGKFRRYHGEGLKQLLDLPTVGKNIRDAWFVLVGIWQSFRLLGQLRPDVIFTRGGFVSVPVGLAAAMRRIPYVTHDSDAIPSLANRLIARWATRHAVALPIDLYPYPPSKTIDVGVPVSHHFQPITARLQQLCRKQLGLQHYRHLLLVTGGGLGSDMINKVMVAIAPGLLRADPDLAIVHLTGHKHEAAVSAAYTRDLVPAQRKRVIVRAYVNDLYRYSGAADVIVARGGATTLAEFAQQGRACVIIPSPHLTADHQTKNARAYAERGAIVELSQHLVYSNPEILEREVVQLLQHDTKRLKMIRSLHTFARPDSASVLARLLMSLVPEGQTD